jgi:hypothetical protein
MAPNTDGNENTRCHKVSRAAIRAATETSSLRPSARGHTARSRSDGRIETLSGMGAAISDSLICTSKPAVTANTNDPLELPLARYLGHCSHIGLQNHLSPLGYIW